MVKKTDGRWLWHFSKKKNMNNNNFFSSGPFAFFTISVYFWDENRYFINCYYYYCQYLLAVSRIFVNGVGEGRPRGEDVCTRVGRGRLRRTRRRKTNGDKTRGRAETFWANNNNIVICSSQFIVVNQLINYAPSRISF